MLRLLDKEKLSQADVAKHFGVTRQAVHQRIKQLRGETTKVVVARKIHTAVKSKLDAMDQLRKVNDYANELLDLCMRWQRGDDEALQILEGQMKKVRIGKTEKFVEEFKFKDPRDVALKAMAEIRGQLKLQLDIFQALYDLQAAQEFQEEVLAAIEEVAPDVRAKIVRRINQKRAIRSAVRFD
jgi:predicted transcriptional regulator